MIFSTLWWSELCVHIFGHEIVKNSYFSYVIKFHSQYSGKQVSFSAAVVFKQWVKNLSHFKGKCILEQSLSQLLLLMVPK